MQNKRQYSESSGEQKTTPKQKNENQLNFESYYLAATENNNWDIKAPYKLARRYELGLGTDTNIPEAINWYIIAASSAVFLLINELGPILMQKIATFGCYSG